MPRSGRRARLRRRRWSVRWCCGSRTSLFAFDVDDSRPMSPTSAGIIAVQIALYAMPLLSKMSRHFGLECKIHVLRNVPGEPGDAHGVEFGRNISR